MLIDCLVYIAILALVFTLAMSCFFKFDSYSRDLRRNAEDVARALKAGERWRADVRHAIAVEWSRDASPPSVRLTLTDGEVRYGFNEGRVWREEDAGPRETVLARVAASAMTEEQGKHVRAVRWELELASRKPATRIRPLFTFTAVPETEVRR